MTVTISWTELARNYRGFCVALLEKHEAERVTVVATGKEFWEAQENAKKIGYPDAWVVVVPEEDTLFMGGGYEIPLSNLHIGPEVDADWFKDKKTRHSD